MMIPWRDYSFLKDEDDLALLDEIHSAKEEPVTGAEAVTESGPRTIDFFNNFEHDGSTKNHILLFGLDLGLFLTVTVTTVWSSSVLAWQLLGVLIFCYRLDLIEYFWLKIILQTFVIMKNRDSASESKDLLDLECRG